MPILDQEHEDASAVRGSKRASGSPSTHVIEDESGDDAKRKRTEARIERFERFFAFYLIAFGTLIFISIVFLAFSEWKTTEFLDFLAYALPCLAAIAVGFGAYYETMARILFGVSGLLLALGFGFYLAAHGQAAWIVGLIFLALIVFSAVVALEAFSEIAHGRSIAVKWLIGVLSTLFFLAITATGAALLASSVR